MRKRFATLAAAACAVVASIAGAAAPVSAITNGTPDNGAHPMVGIIVFYDANGAPMHRCTGTMISNKVMLTAGHCTAGTASAQAWFDEYVVRDGTQNTYPFGGGFVGTPHTYSGYTGSLPNTGDIGVVVLQRNARVGRASIAPVGTLDSLATARGTQDVHFDVVGYGLQQIKPTELRDTNRLKASVRLVNLRSALTDGYNIHHSGAPGTGGGTCFGDSGGPIFTAGTNQIVAVTSFGLNTNCAGGGFGFRVDTEAAAGFIAQFI